MAAVTNGIFKGRSEVRYNYGRYGKVRGLGTVWHYGLDIVGLDDDVIYMPGYNGKSIMGKVTRARIVTNRSNKTWEWGWYICVQLLSNQTPDSINFLYFCHCKSLLVKVGQIVKTGDALAVMGNTGNAALNDPPYCHCHFEVRATATGKGLDPTAYAGIPNRIGIYGVEPSSTTQTPIKAPVAGTKEDWTTAKSKDDSAKYGVRYRVYPYALHLRKGAGTDQPIVKTLRAGTTLAYYGLYTMRDGVKWMYVMLSDKTTGFVSEQYIKKA